MKKETQFQIKGISQDLAYQLFNPQYAFEMKNIRINTTDNNSLLSLTNEKGTSDVGSIINMTINGVNKDYPATVLGWGQFSDYTVLFSKSKDAIEPEHVDTYKLVYTNDNTLNVFFTKVGEVYNGILTAQINGTFNVAVEECSVAATQDASTPLQETMVGSMGITDEPVIYDSTLTYGRPFSDYLSLIWNSPGATYISSDYYIAFCFTPEIINMILPPPVPGGDSTSWLLGWNEYYIGGKVPERMGTSSLAYKYIVYNFADKRWYFTDNLNNITTSETRTYPPASRMDFISIFKNDDSSTRVLYAGDLNFQDDTTIHTVCTYENEDIQKVYWVDGVNPPRVANVAPNTWDDADRNLSFQKIDFLPNLKFGEKIYVDKTSGGSFPSGVMQFALTYSDQNLQETNLFYTSPLYYLGQPAKGAAPDETCNTAFNVSIKNADTGFDYIQCYVLVRTSLNAKPAAYRISNIPCKKFFETNAEENNTIDFIINGYNWEAYDPDSVAYKQLSNFVPKIITSKDSTLFLGNYTLESPFVKSSDMQNFLQHVKNSLHFNYINLELSNDTYSYELLGNEKSVKTFRSRQPYRIGIQFQDEKGTPTNTLYVDDVIPRTTNKDNVSDSTFKQKTLAASINGSLINDKRLKRARLMMVDRTSLPKNTIAQGVLCPTVYKIDDRVNNQPFAISSWIMRGFSTSCLKDFDTSWPTESNAQWMTDMPLMINTVKRGGEIATQSQVNLKGIKTNDSGGGVFPVSDSSITVRPSSGSSTDYYFFLFVENWVYPKSKQNNLYIEVGRTTDATDYLIEDIKKRDPNIDFYKSIDFGKDGLIRIAADIGVDAYTSSGVRAIAMKAVKEACADVEGFSETILYRLFQDWYLPPYQFITGSPYIAIGKEHGIIEEEIPFSSCYPVKVQQTLSNNFDAAYGIAQGFPYFFCDHNVLTFHSPDVENNKQLIDNNNNIKYRIVGYTKIDRSYFDTYLHIDVSPKVRAGGGVQVIPKNSQTGICNSALWRDTKLFPVYIWHRTMSLGEQDAPDEEDGKIYGSYSRKVFSNFHFCGESKSAVRLKSGSDSEYEVIDCDLSSDTGQDRNMFPAMSTPRVFDSNEAGALTLEGQYGNANLYSKLIYYGNINTSYVSGAAEVPIVNETTGNYELSSIINTDTCMMQYKSSPHVVFSLNYVTNHGLTYSPSLPIPRKGEGNPDDPDDPDDPIIAGSFLDITKPWWHRSNDYTTGYLWSLKEHNYYRSLWDFSLGNNEDPEGLLYIAELYQDLSTEQIYGNTSEDNLSKHTWIPISDWVDLSNDEDGGGEAVGYGDTFIGRWDCLKTYSFTEEDIQSYVDITSFIVESDVNLQSRYDNYKGMRNGTVINPEKFNLFNPVYDQLNNFFQYHYLKESEALNNFQNQVCWSDVKNAGEELDTWAQINVGNNQDFQGEYGQLRAGMNFANNLYFLQDNAIYKMNYNTRVAISPTDGVPIQISNNYTVEPPLLLKQFCGTDDQNKTVVSPNMAYFFDPNRNRIFGLSPDDQVTDISTVKGVNSLISSGINRLFYDSQSKDILFNLNDTDKGMLAFNEDIQEFTSLYDYTGISSLFSAGTRTLVTRDAQVIEDSQIIEVSHIWGLREGDYNNFFYEYKPFYVDLLLNQDPLNSKMFTNLDYTMVGDNDATMSSATDAQERLKPLDNFDTLEVHNSYQENSVNLTALRYTPSNLKRKFRTWAIDIPRDRGTRDRMCDMWLRVKLIKEAENTNKYRINNVNSTYYIV